MTGIVMRTEKAKRELGPAASALLGPPVSNRTAELAHQVQALQSRPSPGSLPALGSIAEKALQERLFDALADVKILTSQVAMHIDGEWRDRLFRQLDSLHDPAEWEDGNEPIQQSSFATFLKAMLSINPERRPGLGLSHTGHLIAAWTTDQDRLTIEFLPNDRVRWVLSRHYEGDTARFAGDTAVSRLAEGLASYHPEHWFAHAQKEREFA
jgi:hypothetical protein